MTELPLEVALAESEAALAAGWHSFFRQPLTLAGGTLLILLLGLVVVGPHVTPYDPTAIGPTPLAYPSPQHLLGTDSFGRDILSRVLAGGGTVILLPLVAVAAAMTVAVIVGLVSGYLGGVIDGVISRVVDVVLSLPSYLTVLVVLSAFGSGNTVVVAAVAIVYAPYIIRVLRAATQTVAPREFVLAAVARGESLPWILFREILPNIGPTLLVEIALRLTYAVIFIASLSFLGLGVRPPAPNWAVMVSENRILLLTDPIVELVPAALIGVLAISINLLADALTQHFSVSEAPRR